jgi:hypothetical protein
VYLSTHVNSAVVSMLIVFVKRNQHVMHQVHFV